jgi:hypothetical protein
MLYVHCDTLLQFLAAAFPDNNPVSLFCYEFAVNGKYDICTSSSVRRELRSSGSSQLNLVNAEE